MSETRYAKMPPDCNALEKADKAVLHEFRDDPDLVDPGPPLAFRRQINMSDQDYMYRKAWMDAYEEHCDNRDKRISNKRKDRAKPGELRKHCNNELLEKWVEASSKPAPFVVQKEVDIEASAFAMEKMSFGVLDSIGRLITGEDMEALRVKAKDRARKNANHRFEQKLEVLKERLRKENPDKNIEFEIINKEKNQSLEYHFGVDSVGPYGHSQYTKITANSKIRATLKYKYIDIIPPVIQREEPIQIIDIR